MSPRAPVTRRSQASGARSNFRKGEYDCSITSASWTRTRRCRSAVLARTMCGVSSRYWSPPVVVTLTPSGSLRCAYCVSTPASTRRSRWLISSPWSGSRSEEHTSELQSQSNLVCRLLLGKKKHTSELQSQSNIVCRLLLGKEEKVCHVEATNEHMYEWEIAFVPVRS